MSEKVSMALSNLALEKVDPLQIVFLFYCLLLEGPRKRTMRMILFAHSLIGKKKDLLTKTVAETVLSDLTDPWTKQVNLMLSRIEIKDMSSVSRLQLKRIMDTNHITVIQQAKDSYSSLSWAAEPEKWFHLNPCVMIQRRVLLSTGLRQVMLALATEGRVNLD